MTGAMGRLQAKVERIQVQGFRSLANIDVSLSDLAVIIGANGSGKSNFIRFFDMLSWMLRSQKLGEYVERQGGADDQLTGGSKTTPALSATLHLRTESGRNDYQFSLAYGHPDRFFFSRESFRFSRSDMVGDAPWRHLEGGHREAAIVDLAQNTDTPPGGLGQTAKTIVSLLRSCKVFHFHDTSANAPFTKNWDVTDNRILRSHGGNLAAILYTLKETDFRRYTLICRQIARILPGFKDFDLEERFGKVSLRWQSRDFPEKTFGAHLTSDGSLRLFALVTLLNLPPEMLPDVILLDEPELGLHPAAVALIGQMIHAVSREKQVILATQSPLLVNTFALDEIIVAEAEKGCTRFRSLSAGDFKVWLDDGYLPGDLWLKNAFGGRP